MCGSRGAREYEALIGAAPSDALAELRAQNPGLYDSLVEAAFGKVLARAELSREFRELATVAILAAAGGTERQLATHVAAAMRVGLAVYAGFPRMSSVSRTAGDCADGAVADPRRFESLALLATTDYPFDTFEARARSGEVDGMEPRSWRA